jgi:hypothetical protein
MIINRILFAACVLFTANVATGASIRLANAEGLVPFAITLPMSETSPFAVVLQMANPDQDITVLIWQLALRLRPDASASGSLHFSAVFAPEMSLFGEVPGPVSDLIVPNDRITVFDGDLLGGGQPILAGDARNIVGILISAGAGASGTFEFLTPRFDPNSPTAGSSFLSTDSVEPMPFDNAAPSALDGYILLGTITVTEVPEPTSACLMLIVGAILGHLTGSQRHSFGTVRPECL